MASVSFSRRDEEWIVRGEPRRSGQEGELLLVREDLEHIPAVVLKNALAANTQFYGAGRAVALLSELPEEHFDADGPVSSIGLELAEGQLFVTVMCTVDWPESGHELDAAKDISSLLAPFLASHRGTLRTIEENDWWSGPTHVSFDLRIAFPWRGKTAAELFELGEKVQTLCDSFAGGRISRETVADLVRGGHARLLIGQPEGNWLDAKSEEYDLATTAGKIRLAQAVARFANAEDGGLIVIGAKARKNLDGEVIHKVDGVLPRQEKTLPRYMGALNQHLYPPPLGMRIDVIPVTAGPRVLICVEVPPQPEELKPFLVHGAIAEHGVEGAFISIVQRRGEGSIPITAAAIHSSIAAGRALLRGAGGASRP